MKIKLVILYLLISGTVLAQSRKTKNIVFISIDGYRWQEIFHGADSSLMRNKKFVTQDSASLTNKFWEIW